MGKLYRFISARAELVLSCAVFESQDMGIRSYSVRSGHSGCQAPQKPIGAV